MRFTFTSLMAARLESSGVFQAEAVAEHVYRLAFTAEESKVYDFHIKFA